MPFLGAIPLIASSLGATLPTALSVALPALSGAFGLASGVAKGDPISALAGAAEGALGGLGGAGALGGTAASMGGAASQGATGAAQGSTAAAPILSAGETAANAVSSVAAPAAEVTANSSNLIQGLPDISKYMSGGFEASGPPQLIPEISNSAGQAFLAPGNAVKGMSTMDKISNIVGGASAATSGVMGLINAFRGPKGGSSGGVNFGTINSYLPAMSGGSLNQLPGAPQFEAGSTQTPFNIELPGNELFYELMNSFRG